MPTCNDQNCHCNRPERYYICDKETFTKLKFVHKVYWQAVHDFHVWDRWQRKDPKNRPGHQPKLNPIFITGRPWIRETKDKDGNTKHKYFPKTIEGHGIVEMYRDARYPSTIKREGLDRIEKSTIEQLYIKAKEWEYSQTYKD